MALRTRFFLWHGAHDLVFSRTACPAAISPTNGFPATAPRWLRERGSSPDGRSHRRTSSPPRRRSGSVGGRRVARRVQGCACVGQLGARVAADHPVRRAELVLLGAGEGRGRLAGGEGRVLASREAARGGAGGVRSALRRWAEEAGRSSVADSPACRAVRRAGPRLARYGGGGSGDDRRSVLGHRWERREVATAHRVRGLRIALLLVDLKARQLGGA